MTGAVLYSIVTVCYNAESVISKTIESVLNQSFKNYEYIIIDGQSNDQTLAIIKKYGAQISKVISEKDHGVYDAMNKALTYAKGEWIIFLNAGDEFPNPFVLEKVSTQLSGDITYGTYKTLTGQRGKWQFHSYFFLTFRTICHQAIFYRNTVFKKIGGFDLQFKFLADFDHMLKAKVHKLKFHRLTEAIVKYQGGGMSVAPQNLEKSFNERLAILLKYPIPFIYKKIALVNDWRLRRQFLNS
jgi:glycosyltransferase involved in cell wall biosynthesis